MAVPSRGIKRALRAPLDGMVERRLFRELSAAGLHPTTAVLPEDVVVVGYPKSGNTWFGWLVAGTVYGVDVGSCPPALKRELVPDVHGKRYYFRFQTPMFFKSHHLPQPEYRRVVYLLRDGRDVMVSYFHHLRALGEIDDGVDLLGLVRRGDTLFPSRWDRHVEAWERNPFGAEKITIRYEDLLQDPARELRAFCEFVGIERDDAELATVGEQAAFDRLQARERATRDRPNPNWSSDAPFFRRGKAGSYQDEMSAEALAAFLEQAGSTLERCGYRLDRAIAAPTGPVSQ